MKPNREKQVVAKESNVLPSGRVTSKTNTIAHKDEIPSNVSSRPKLVMNEERAPGNPGWPNKIDSTATPKQMKPVSPPVPTSSGKLQK